MIANIIVFITATVASCFLLLSKRLAHSSNWQATVTPLASIMGSGFLVCAPLLADSVGNKAIFAIATLLLLAYCVGEAVRFNIRYAEPLLENGNLKNKPVINFLENFSHIVLAVAYFISVSYYLQLLATFVLKGFNIQNHWLANIITTVILLSIGFIGWWRGLGTLESVEKYAVSINLAMIAALLVGLFFYNLQLTANGTWHLPSLHPVIDFGTIRILLGLLIVVQGFEISRFLGNEHPAPQRIKTMRYAQIISSLVYLIFIGLITILFKAHGGKGITAIVDMSATVASLLPPLLLVAAIGSQFSAAVADFSGAEGLISEMTEKKIAAKNIFLLVTAITILLTWTTNIVGIISLASRAFALFYALQCMVAWRISSSQDSIWSKRSLFFGSLAIVCLFVTIFGISAD